MHTSKADSELDHISILATNNIRTKGFDVDIIIQAIDSQLPTLSIIYEQNNVSTDTSYLSLLQGSAVTIDSGFLEIEDADSEDGQYTIYYFIGKRGGGQSFILIYSLGYKRPI